MKDHSPNPNLDYYHLPLAPNQHVVVEQEPAAVTSSDTILHTQEHTRQQEQSCRRAFTRIALAISVMLVVWVSSIFALFYALSPFFSDFVYTPAFSILSSSFCLVLFAIPSAYLVIRTMPTATPTISKPLGGAKIILLVFMSMGILVVGNIISNALMSAFSALINQPLINSLNATLNAPIWVTTLCTVILAPIFEELFCRKILLTRLLPYGEVTAVLLSSLLFAFIHGNLFQFLYAFGTGLLFSVLYLRTGRLRYCITLHMCVNALGSLISLLLLSGMSTEMMTLLLSEQAIELTEEIARVIFENLLPTVALFLYNGLEYAIAAAGIILLLVFFKKFRLEKQPDELSASRALSLFLSSAGGITLLVVNILFTLMNMGVFGV